MSKNFEVIRDPSLNKFLEFSFLAALKQHNLVRNKHDRILDVVLSNSENIEVIESDFCLVSKDENHPALEIEYSVA